MVTNIKLNESTPMIKQLKKSLNVADNKINNIKNKIQTLYITGMTSTFMWSWNAGEVKDSWGFNPFGTRRCALGISTVDRKTLKTLRFLETSRCDYTMTRHHVPEERTPRLHRCQYLKTRKEKC
jgi:hypothetical protein